MRAKFDPNVILACGCISMCSFGIRAGFGLYDTTGSYSGALIASIGLGIFAALVNLPVNEKRFAERRVAAA